MKPIAWWMLVLISVCASYATMFSPRKDSSEEEERFPADPLQAKRNHGTTVAFHATFHGTLTGAGRIPYDHLLLNEGNGFDILIHAFTAPRDGIYVFSVEANSRWSYGCVELRKNHMVVTQGKAYWKYSRIAIHAP